MDSGNAAAREIGNAEPGSRGRETARVSTRAVPVILPIVVVILITLVIIAPIWQPGYPWANDSWGHLQRAGFMGMAIRQYGLIGGIAQSSWMPAWYLGDPMTVYYTPLTVYMLGPLVALFGDVFLVYRLFVTTIFLGIALSVYFVGVRWGHNRPLAVAGALLAILSPYTVTTMMVEGSLSRGLPILLLPWVFYFTERLLKDKAAHYPIALLSAMWALIIIAHLQLAAMFAIAVAFYAVLRAINNLYVPLRRVILALLPIAIGAGLAAVYILPAYSHAELRNVPSVIPQKVNIYSVPLSGLLPYQTDVEAVSVGLVGAVLAVLVTFAVQKDYEAALLGVAIVCVVLAFGPAGGLYNLLPFNDLYFPQRFLNISAILFPLIVATAPLGLQRRYWLALGVLLVVLIDGVPALRGINMRAVPVEENGIAQVLAGQTMPGRVAPLTYPDATSAQIYLTNMAGGKDNVAGWAIEATPQQNAVRRLVSAATLSPAYLNRVLSLWNVDYVVARLKDASQSTKVASAVGFARQAQSGSLELWTRSGQPSAFVQSLPGNRMLIIGDNPTDWTFVFPYASEGQSSDPANYTADYLDHYSVIGMTRIPDKVNIEQALGDWIGRGNTLIVDLSGVGAIYNRGYTLFGVQAVPTTLTGRYSVSWPQELKALPGSLDFSSQEGPWNGATYYGLDGAVAQIDDLGKSYPLLGYRNVGKGRVWFIGFNLMYLLDQSSQQDSAAAIADYVLSGTAVNRDLNLPPFPVTVTERSATHLALSYTSAKDIDVVLSMTYFPRWQAVVDGNPVILQDHENLMLIHLPAGSHSLTLDYHLFGTGIAQAGLLASGLSVIGLAFTMLWLRRRPPLGAPERERSFDDRLPAPPPAPPIEYAACPGCGFRLAISGPPNEKSYPFNALDCPICGFSVGDSSFLSGARQTPYMQRRLALAWLKENNLSKEQLRSQFGLTVESLFENPPLPPGTLEQPEDIARRTVLRGDIHWINAVAFNLTGSMLASAGDEGTLRLWSAESGLEMAKLEGHMGAVQSVAYDAQGMRVASGGNDKIVRLWSISPVNINPVAELKGHTERITRVAFNLQGTLLASGDRDCVVRLWSVEDRKEVGVLSAQNGSITALGFSPAGDFLAVGSAIGTIQVWKVATQEVMRVLRASDDPILSLAVSADAQAIVSVNASGAIRTWEVASGQGFSLMPPSLNGTISSATFNADGNLLALADSRLRLLDGRTGDELTVLDEASAKIVGLAFSADDNTLAVINADGSATLWRMKD